MPPAPPRRSSREKVRAHRDRLRAQGLRPIQIWVPDTRAPGFAEEARRQSLLVAAEEDFDEVMNFIERVSVFDEDEDDTPEIDAPR
jgi:hypothetical protein